MLSVYATAATLSSHLLAVREKERVAGMQGITLARLKIVPSYHQELVSHLMPEHIEALG